MGSSTSNGFFIICILHSTIALACGSSIIFYLLKDVAAISYGPEETASKLIGSTPHDQLLVQISESFAGVLLIVIGILLWMVSFVKDTEFHGFFAKGCVLLHFLMMIWRVAFERRIQDSDWHWQSQTLGDFFLALSWVSFLVFSWREKYD